VAASVPFPIEDPRQVIDAVLGAATTRTRLAVIDHISSATALVFPIERIVAELGARGIDVLVDGAHAPGSVPLDLASLGAAYYVGNCHKWMCAPKGSGFLWARSDRQNGLVPTSVSHGANSEREDRSRFRELFDWTGTADPTPYLAVPEAIARMSSVLPGGWGALMSSNRALALRGRELLCEALGIEEPAPSSMIASMCSVPIWDRRDESDHVTTALLERGIEALIEPWPSKPHRVLRISAQVYNREEEYRMLAEALKQLAG
jgi:isopenicillin-N epimerase